MTKRTCDWMLEGVERVKMSKITPESISAAPVLNDASAATLNDASAAPVLNDASAASISMIEMEVDEAPCEAPRCPHCTRYMVNFEETLINGSPDPEDLAQRHYWAQVENWQVRFGHKGISGGVCSMVPRGSHYPLLENFPDGVPICQMFTFFGVDYWAVYNLGVSGGAWSRSRN